MTTTSAARWTRLAAGSYKHTDGCQITRAYTEGRDYTPRENGWHLIGPDGEWWQTFVLLDEAKAAHAEVARRVAQVEAIADAAEPVEEDEPGDPTINLGTRVAAALSGSIVPVASITARQPGQVLVTVSDRVIGNPDRYESGSVVNARAYSARGILARAGFRGTPTGGDGVFVEDSHLMSDDLLDACGTAPQGRGLLLIPDTATASELITCPRCLLLAVDGDVQRLGYTSAARYLADRPELRERVEVAADEPDSTAPIPVDLGEADVPPTADERVTVRIRTTTADPDTLGPEIDDPRDEPTPQDPREIAAP
jgi:hypothetical protein